MSTRARGRQAATLAAGASAVRPARCEHRCSPRCHAGAASWPCSAAARPLGAAHATLSGAEPAGCPQRRLLGVRHARGSRSSIYGRYPPEERWRVDAGPRPFFALRRPGVRERDAPQALACSCWSSCSRCWRASCCWGGVFGPALCRHRPLGRPDGQRVVWPSSPWPARCRSASCWRSAGGRTCRSCAALDRLHRAVARRAAACRAVHGRCHAAAVPAQGRRPSTA